MEMEAYYKWRERMDAEGIRFFRRKNRRLDNRLLEMLSSSWNGGTGMVYLNYAFVEKKRYTADIRTPYTDLEPLNAMEVIALCAAIES